MTNKNKTSGHITVIKIRFYFCIVLMKTGLAIKIIKDASYRSVSRFDFRVK